VGSHLTRLRWWKNGLFKNFANFLRNWYHDSMWSGLSASVSYSFWSISECSFLFSRVSL